MEEELAAKKESEKRAVGGVAAIGESPDSAPRTSSSSNESKAKHPAKDKISKKED